MARDNPVLITDAREDPQRELKRREARYIAMMLFRVLCLLAAALIVAQKPPVWQLWSVLAVVGAVLLPWLAVLLANDRPAKKRRGARLAPSVTAQPALEPREHRVIDAEEP